MEFYATAAQVIPTLFLAMAFGGGILSWKREAPAYERVGKRRWFSFGQDNRSYAAIHVVLLMILGEASALFALAVNDNWWLLLAVAWVGLIAGLIGVAAPVVHAHWSGIEEAESKVMLASTALLAFALVTFLAMTATIVVYRK